MSRAALWTWVIVVGSACQAELRGVASRESPAAPVVEADELETENSPLATFSLPSEWRTSPLESFESWVQAALPADQPTAIEKASLRELKSALDGFDLVALRAAIILARSRDPQGYEVMLQRLEKRALGPNRPDDAADVVCAAALGQVRNVKDLGGRLESLVNGDEDKHLPPHPDLEVRVECACSLLEYPGRQNAGMPFLLRVLRDQTHAADDSKRDWTPTPHMAWAKSRAAFAISKYLRVPCEFRPDGSIEHEAREAARLEKLWREKRRLVSPPTH